MSGETCAVLSAVFPLVLLAFIAERRNLTMKARRSGLFRQIAQSTAVAAVVGLPLTIFGVQREGLAGVAAVMAWALFGASVAGLFVLTGFHVATTEIEEDEPEAGGAHRPPRGA
ncbi:hypothetical protein [Microbacterium sp. JZ31]|uniref:hypothetical protein n=1 Tax=Microbacterium sp. JZ31 TaxID=1906274 RepID=UPI0019336D9D|nr:hypothetical protein [Microbacterium sp. JZ31]